MTSIARSTERKATGVSILVALQAMACTHGIVLGPLLVAILQTLLHIAKAEFGTTRGSVPG